jgi:PAS domain S-box-containing protein
MHESPTPVEAPAPGSVADSTVLRHSNVSVADLVPGKVADAQELLEDALKSNMETARLYSELKQVKETLEKKSAEMAQLYTQLERANQDNLKTRRYLEGLVQNIGEAVISCAPDGKILTWNSAAERIFGYSRPEIVGRNMAQLTPDSLLGELEQVAQQVLRGQVIRDLVTTRLRKGGVTFPACVTFAPVRGNEDRIQAYSTLVRDTSDQGEKPEAALRLGPKGDGLSRLVPSLFHEAANRLTPVLLEARLIAEAALDPHQAEQAGRLVQAVDSVQSLLKPLQTLLNPPQAERTATQLNDVAREAVSALDPMARDLGVAVELSLDPALPLAALDAGLLRQALEILLRQGLRSMASSPLKRLRVATRQAADNLQLVIQDAGPALSEDQRREAFDPEAARSLEGLDLPIAQVIARQHGGRLGVRSQEGMGNAFLMELPFLAPPEPETPRPLPRAKGLKGSRALVVDDEAFLLECLVDALSTWGLEVSACSRGDEAIQQLESGAFDVIVSDIRMPGLSGMDLFDWLKVQRPHMVGRILYTTGDAFDVKTREFLETSQVSFLGKPFDLKQLKQSLERLLERPAEA